MLRLIALDYDWVQKVMVRYLDFVSANDYWENRIMVVAVYSTLLHYMSETEPYQRHIKMKNAEMVKAVTVENEMMIRLMKEMVEKVAQAISKVLEKNYNTDVSKVSMIYLVDVMSESRQLVSVFVN